MPTPLSIEPYGAGGEGRMLCIRALWIRREGGVEETIDAHLTQPRTLWIRMVKAACLERKSREFYLLEDFLAAFFRAAFFFAGAAFDFALEVFFEGFPELPELASAFLSDCPAVASLFSTATFEVTLRTAVLIDSVTLMGADIPVPLSGEVGKSSRWVTFFS